MTRLEKEIDDMLNTLLFPARYAKSFVGNGSSYPPYNIIKISDQRVVLELAVAGFKESELSVVVEDGQLKVSGAKDTSQDTSSYIYKGIGARSFERSFTLSQDAKIDKAEYADGILSVFVEYITPDTRKPNHIPINKGDRVYLTE